MLGTLARWLRLAGHDTTFLPDVADEEVLAHAVAEGRWLLTKDRPLAAKGPRTLLVRSVAVDDQLVEVAGRLRLAVDPDLTTPRCAACNGEVVGAEPDRVRGRVPPYVAATHGAFRECRSCGRVFWPGTHADRIRERLSRAAARLAEG